MRRNYKFKYKPRKELYERVPCICQIRTANICFKGAVIGTLSEEKNDAGEFDWVIKINWPAWEKAGRPQISGIDDINKQDEYIRRYIPAIVTQRTLPDERDGLYEELERVGLKHNDRFEYMCRTHGVCGPSRLTIERQ